MSTHSVTMEGTLRKLLEEKKYSTLRDILITMNPADIGVLIIQSASCHGASLPFVFRNILSHFSALEKIDKAQELA